MRELCCEKRDDLDTGQQGWKKVTMHTFLVKKQLYNPTEGEHSLKVKQLFNCLHALGFIFYQHLWILRMMDVAVLVQ